MRKYRTIISVFVLVGLLIVVLGAQADSDSRYFIRSKKAFWKNTFGARHVFEDGFSADLSDWQVKLAKVFNVKLEPVQMLQILPEGPQGPEAPGGGVLGPPLDVPGIQRPGGGGKPDKPSKSTGGDRIVPSDPTSWGVEYVYSGGADESLKETSGGEDVTVAILDTGVDKDHPDLKNRIAQCKDFTHPKAVVRDGKCDDRNGHGTHVAGIIGADGGDDGLGIYGIAPEVSLWVYKVCDVSGSCWADDIAGAIRHAADMSVNIINLSLGSDVEIPMVSAAMDYAKEKAALVVVAAGNDGPESGTIDYPAAHLYAVSVGAFDFEFNVPDWSSRGVNPGENEYVKEAKEVEFAAPGVEIESTWKDGGYSTISGTSMGTPFITGLAAKLWDGDAEITRTLLQTLAKPNDIGVDGDDNATGFGFPVNPITITVE